MTVSLIKTSDITREVEAAAVDRLASPLGRDSWEAVIAWRDDALLVLGRRGTRDALCAECARRGTWVDALARIVISDIAHDPTVEVMVRQNALMFTAINAWRVDMRDYALDIVASAPDWEHHRGLELVGRLLLKDVPFTGWETAMKGITMDICLDYQN